MTPNRAASIAIFLPRDTPFYRGVIAQMVRGFSALGLRVHGHLGLLGADDFRAFYNQHQPELVLEMNRPRCEAEFIPKAACHICWVVDFNGRPLSHFEGSELTYLFGPASVERYPHSGFCRWLGPGACPVDYSPRALPFSHDASFAAHIPRPWSQAELDRPIAVGETTTTHFRDILQPIEVKLNAKQDALVSAEEYFAFVDAVCVKRSGVPATLDDRLRYDISGRLVRALNRRTLVDRVLEAGCSLQLFGPPNWREWPRYAPHYARELSLPSEMHEAYARSRINLHEGTGIHFRSMDIMSTGGLLFFRESPEDELPGGMNRLFEPEVHYVPFTIDNLPERMAELLADPERAARIRRNAAAEIARAHTWECRARDILRDVQLVKGS
jgi:hypothetical protein